MGSWKIPRILVLVGGIVGLAIGFEPIWAGQPIWGGHYLFTIDHKWALIAVLLMLLAVTWARIEGDPTQSP